MKFKCVNIANDENLSGRSFVGFFKNKESYQVYTPYGFYLPNEIDNQDQMYINQLKIYAKSITSALKYNRLRNSLEYTKDGNSNPEIALKIIHDYFQNGLFRDYEKNECNYGLDNINFKKTFSRVVPSIVNEDLIYDHLVNVKRKVYFGLASQIQANIINHFMMFGGELFIGKFIRINVPNLDFNLKLIRDLRIEKLNTSNSRKQQLLSWSIDYICGAINQKHKGEWNYAIVASTLWEEMIDLCYSNQEKRNRTKYGQNYRMFYSPFESLNGSYTQHDTVCEFKDYILIIDAKMYSDSKYLLREEILGKQFGYYHRAKELNTKKKIFNILIKPSIISQRFVNAFEAVIPSPEIKRTMDLDNFILIYSLDYVKLMDAYCMQKKLHVDLLAEAIEFEKTEDFKSLKSIWLEN